MPVQVRALTPTGLVPHLDEIELIYRLAFAADRTTSGRFQRRLMEESQTQPGFRFLVAEDPNGIVGFIYGYHLRADNWWPELIRPAMLAAGLGEWLDDTFELVEFAVDPDRQLEGVGRRLYETLLETVTEPRLLLGTEPPPTIAHRFYSERGWLTLVPEWRHQPEDAEYHLIMGLERGAQRDTGSGT